MGVIDAIRRLDERRIERLLRGRPRPGHVGIVMDGNRRWARQVGFADPGVGHRYGSEHVATLLGWCRGLGIRQVTVFVASTDNLTKRHSDEVAHLMGLVEEVVAEQLTRPGSPWRVHLAGRLDLLPDSTAQALKHAAEVTAGRATDADVTIAIAYGGREEIVDAVRSLLEEEARAGATARELAGRLTDADIAAHLYTAGRADPDLIIRTSGERRLSGFLIWQSTRSELHFCDSFWPGFRRIDLLRALRSYAARRAGI
ncbi:polyprenyl diphosphate synthase [Pseudonocardia sp. DLS-67]